MNDDQQYIIETGDTTSTERTTPRFPVIAQLSILAFVLFAILGFSVLPLLKGGPAETTDMVASSPLVIAGTSTALALTEKMSEVTVRGKVAFVYDVTAKRVLYQKNPDQVVPLASITKLMTALITHELVADDARIVIPKSAVFQSGESGLREGDILTTQALMDYSMLSSSNDAAFALAAAVGTVLEPTSNPQQTFVTSMNIRAEELGLPNLKFANPTGLDISPTEPGAVGTAREVTFLMEYILTNYPSILEPSTFTSTRVYDTAGSYHQAENTNPIVTQIPNLLGSKTGYTDLAGGNLTVAFDAGYNRPIIITVMGSSYDERFTDVLKLVKAVTGSIE